MSTHSSTLQPSLNILAPILKVRDLTGYGREVCLEGGEERFKRVQQANTCLEIT